MVSAGRYISTCVLQSVMKLHRSLRDAFCLYFDAKTKKITALNGSGRAPMRLSVDYVRERGVKGNSIPLTDLNSVTVPGTSEGFPC